MKANILKCAFLFAVICLAGGMGYFLGFKRAGSEVARNYSAGSLMFFTAIHKSLEEGDYVEAKRFASAGASCQILAIDNIDRYPLSLHFWSIFPYPEMPDMKAQTKKQLERARVHFSKYPSELMPEAISYLQKDRNE